MPASTAPSTTRTTVQLVALVVGAVFLLVGVLGLVPGTTSGHDQLSFAGHTSGAGLTGLFRSDVARG